MHSEIIIYLLLSAWAVPVCFRISFRSNLKSFYCIGISIVLAAIPVLIPLQKTFHSIVHITGEVVFYLGVILVGTIESPKLRAIWQNTTFTDFIIGNVPREVIERKQPFDNTKQRLLFIGASAALVIYSITELYSISENKISAFALLFIGAVFIIYALASWKTNGSKS